jgi:hypothetical protein
VTGLRRHRAGRGGREDVVTEEYEELRRLDKNMICRQERRIAEKARSRAKSSKR